MKPLKPTHIDKKPQKEQSAMYVNNKEFSAAVGEYATRSRAGENLKIPEYIGECFIRIANGLSHKPNFSGYTYREEMAMDAIENCVKAVQNYNTEKATRTGSPNAFGYFTQICYYAFLRRMAKEKRQSDIKLNLIDQAGADTFMTSDEGDPAAAQEAGFVDVLRRRAGTVKAKEQSTLRKRILNRSKKKSLEHFMP